LTVSCWFAGVLDSLSRDRGASRPEGLELFAHPHAGRICAGAQQVVRVTAALYSTHPAERRDHARTPFACSSCSDTTAGAPSRAAAIARAAAIPPAIVVTHGTPRATAARRIS
jgi:hypothetical protein